MIEYPIVDRYIDWLVDHFAALRGLALPIVLDCSHGATAAVIPQLVQRLGWSNARLLCATVDGTFPSHPADPVVSANVADLRAAVLAESAFLGLGFDGDGDRMGPISSSGKVNSGRSN